MSEVSLALLGPLGPLSEVPALSLLGLLGLSEVSSLRFSTPRLAARLAFFTASALLRCFYHRVSKVPYIQTQKWNEPFPNRCHCHCHCGYQCRCPATCQQRAIGIRNLGTNVTVSDFLLSFFGDRRRLRLLLVLSALLRFLRLIWVRILDMYTLWVRGRLTLSSSLFSAASTSLAAF